MRDEGRGMKSEKRSCSWLAVDQSESCVCSGLLFPSWSTQQGKYSFPGRYSLDHAISSNGTSCSSQLPCVDSFRYIPEIMGGDAARLKSA